MATEKNSKTVIDSDVKEVAKILEMLDESSRVLAGT